MTRAQFVPSTMNAEERTVDVVFATPTPVLRYSWGNDEYYNEVLDMNGANLERTSKGLPVLDNHGRWGSVGQILGRAENIRREGESYTATVRFSKREEIQSMVSDIQDGIITDISFGYSVDKIERMDKQEGDQYRTYMVRGWTPNEISFVTIPADPKAGVRSEDGKQLGFDLPEIYNRQNPEPPKTPQTNKSEFIMKREQIIAMLAKRGITVDASISDEALNAELERALTSNGEDPEAVRKAAIDAERKRTADITTAVRSAKLKPEFAEKLISEGKSIEEARALIIDEFAKGDAGRGIDPHIEMGDDKSAKLRTQAATASLIMRSEPELLRGERKLFDDETIAEASSKYRHMSLIDLAKDSLVRGGVSIDGLNKMEIVGRAFTSSTSDFPVLLEGANRTVLLASYTAQADTWKRFCATGSVSDFREHKRLRMGTFSDLDKVQENGQFKNKKITDANYEKVSIGTKGNIINVSRQMIINDDLGGFLRLASMLGRAAARSIENDVYALLASNPTLADGVALFHASHGNIATAAAPTVAVIDGMRQLMAKQKDKDSNDFLDIRPSVALVPLSLGGTLRILNTSQYDHTDTGVLNKPNIVAGLFGDVIDTPRLSGTAYYMFADPTVEPVLEVNFLNGQEMPYMESQNGFDVDGTSWKIRLDYGVGAVGFRGVVKNAGA